MNREITASTRLIALLGDPVSHSLSPVFQNAAFGATGVDGVYLALRCTADALPGLLRGITESGGAGNVTVPHKAAAAKCIQEATEAVSRSGVCNTYWAENGRICGDNTDVAGFARAAEALLGKAPTGARVLLAGAGGAARAVLVALSQARAAEVVVVNRSVERSEELCSRFGGGDLRLFARSIDAVEGQSFDLVVNATSLGIHPNDPFPLPIDGGLEIAAALDLVYAPGRTPWIRALRERGIVAEDGIEMLIHQGAASFERWWGFPPPLSIMRESLATR